MQFTTQTITVIDRALYMWLSRGHVLKKETYDMEYVHNIPMDQV